MASAAGSPHCVAFVWQRELQSVTETAVDPDVPDVVPVVVPLHAMLAVAAGKTERTTKKREILIAAV
jgi:hypothetical protein